MRAHAEGIALEELAVNLAEAGGQGLAVEPFRDRLGVEQVHLAGTAGHEQEDAPLGLRGKLRRLGRQRIDRRPGRLRGRSTILGATTKSASSPNPFPVRARNSRRFSGLIGGGGRARAGAAGCAVGSNTGRRLCILQFLFNGLIQLAEEIGEHEPESGESRTTFSIVWV